VSEESASISELSVKLQTSTSSLRHKDHPPPVREGSRREQLATMDSTEQCTLEELIACERSRYEDGFGIGGRFSHVLTDADMRDLVPQPLAIGAKQGCNKAERHYTSPSSPTADSYDGMRSNSLMQPPPK